MFGAKWFLAGACQFDLDRHAAAGDARRVEPAEELLQAGRQHDFAAGRIPQADRIAAGHLQRFGRFLQRRLRDGAIADTYLGEVVALELAGNALRWGAQPPTRTVRFVHDPVALLAPLADGRRPDRAVPTGDYAVIVDASDGPITMSVAVPSEPASLAPRAARSRTEDRGV